jgi:hypothetical protein
MKADIRGGMEAGVKNSEEARIIIFVSFIQDLKQAANKSLYAAQFGYIRK